MAISQPFRDRERLMKLLSDNSEVSLIEIWLGNDCKITGKILSDGSNKTESYYNIRVRWFYEESLT